MQGPSAASFGLGKAVARRPGGPSLTRWTWLATFPLPLSRREALLSPSRRRPGCSGRDPTRGAQGWPFRGEGPGSGRSPHFGQGRVTACDA